MVKTFFGRRRGKGMSGSKAEFIASVGAEYALDLPCDFGAIFDFAPKRLTLEIGYGYGEHLAGVAAAAPGEGFIGAEIFEDGNYACVRDLKAAGLRNVRLWMGDANKLFEHIGEGVFDRIFVLFPDPWPKSRNEKRRMISPLNLKLFHKFLKPGGELFVASDHPVYIPWVFLSLQQAPGLFKWDAARSGDFKNPPKDWVETRYEAKAREAGRVPIYLRLVKV
ncbi:MAG: tRNA (guanine(46)-N(7))-methyltransferase TrmB [Alphaproteobacteria bacterium]|nr:tRNA (guanine(46)-N(7))-methyltransferase TrmB [Alphaproteobacteria bacterium]